MRLLAIDPGYANCGWVLFDDGTPVKCGVYSSLEGRGRRSFLDRATEVARGLRGVADLYNVDLWVTEKYFGAGVGQGVDYYRGQSDMLVYLLLGHLQGYAVHPLLLKKFVTGKGRADKTKMVESIYEMYGKKWPSFIEHVRSRIKSSTREHVLEAMAIGDVALSMLAVRMGSTDVVTATQKKSLDDHEENFDLPRLSRKHPLFDRYADPL